MSQQEQTYTAFQLSHVPTDFLNKEEISLLKKTLLAKFSEEEQDSFIRMVLRTRLDPWSKQIYATRRYTKVTDENGQTKKVPTLVPVTSIMGLTAIADRTGHYKGCVVTWSGPDGVWKEEWLSEENPAAAKAVVYHSQRTYPEVGIARWMSYAGQTYNYQTKTWDVSDFWTRMPDFMLAKCARAQALRAAFPDQLSNVYIREELDSNITDSDLDTEEISKEEAQVERAQAREDKAKAAGVKFVETTGGTRPTPTEATEEAFESDKVPKRPPAKKAEVAQAPAQAEPPDDLDMTPEHKPEPKPEPESPVGPEPEPAVPWKTHVIRGVKHKNYHGRKVGELTPQELRVIETQWLPQVQQGWNDANDEQRADAKAFESAIAFHKMAKPW